MHIWHISRNYRKLTIVHGNDDTGKREMTSTIRPKTGLPRRDRYLILAGELRMYGITPPPYKEHNDKAHFSEVSDRERRIK